MRIATCLVLLLASLPLSVSAQSGQVRAGLRIGSVDGPDALTRIGGVLVADDGRIFVLQSQEQHVKVFDARGRLVRKVGRKGEGPGEFRNPVSITLQRDTLWVVDDGLRRITAFHADDFRHLETRHVPLDNRPPGAILADGSILESFTVLALEVERTSVIHLARWDGRGERRHPFLSIPISGLFLLLDHGGPWPRVFPNPYSDAPLFSLLPSRDAALLIRRDAWSGAGDATFSVTRLTIHGDTVVHRAFRYEPKRVTETQRNAMLNPRQRAGAPPEVTAALQRALRQIRYLPPITRAAPGNDGTVWLARENQGAEVLQEWILIDQANRVAGSVRLPANVAIRVSLPDGFWATETDALDVEYLVRYTVSWPR
jgi:hypothetical protein